jgi:hypothetical protein
VDNSDNYQDFCLPVGDHTINYMDSYSDGWGTGYWSILDTAGVTIAGGATDGLVADSGGSTDFILLAGGGGRAAAEGSIVVTIFAAGQYADEYSWNIDGGTAFPESPYSDGTTTAHQMTLPDGRHTLYFSK